MKKVIAAFAGITALAGVIAIAQSVNQAGKDWVYPGGDQGGSRFSTLTQINATNVTRLKRAWTFHTGSGRFASAPMVIDSVMYFSAPNGVYAIDAVNGALIWKYAPPAPPPPADAEPAPTGERGAPGAGGRGGRGGGGGYGQGFDPGQRSQRKTEIRDQAHSVLPFEVYSGFAVPNAMSNDRS